MGLHLALFSLCLVVVGIASAAQSAFGYLNATRVRRLMQQGATRSQAMFEVVYNPGPFFSSVALLTFLSVAGATVLALDLVQQTPDGVAVRGALVLAAGLLLLGAHTAGRNIATLRPEAVAAVLYGPLRVTGAVALPLIRPWHLLANGILWRVLKVNPADRWLTTEEDLRLLVDAVEETEALEEEEREMITSIFELSDRDVREIMVPRVDVVAVEGSKPVCEAADLLVSTGHSRMPVFEGDLDHILGLVHLRDLTASLRAGRGLVAVSHLVRPLHVVPETKKIDELLHEFQTQQVQMALVADEYGGTAGVVTVEDLVEEIVGEIRDEYDMEEERIQKISDREAIVDARVSIHDANEALNLRLDAAEYDTIGGLVYDQLGKVPISGDVVRLQHCTISVISTKGRRIQRVRVAMTD